MVHLINGDHGNAFRSNKARANDLYVTSQAVEMGIQPALPSSFFKECR